MKEHDYSIDIARGIACLLVIIGHISSTPSQVNVWIYAFHMPLFFIISGLIINTKEPIDVFIKKRIKGLFFPYFILNILVWVIENLMKFTLAFVTNSEFDKAKSFNELIGVFIGWRLTKYYYILWFVISLFWGLIFSYVVLQFLKNKKLIFICGICLIFLNSIIWKIIGGLPYSLDTVPVSAGFILIGNAIADKIKYCINKKNALFGIPLFLMNGVIAILGASAYGKVDFYNCQVGGVSILIITSMIGSVSVFMLAKLLNRNHFFEFLSMNSLIFYAFQNRIVIPICERVITVLDVKLFKNSLCGYEWMICAVIVVVILSIIAFPINKYIPWAVGKRK